MAKAKITHNIFTIVHSTTPSTTNGDKKKPLMFYNQRLFALPRVSLVYINHFWSLLHPDQ
jgi:hypothetical protein